jgi:hypothetical protein
MKLFACADQDPLWTPRKRKDAGTKDKKHHFLPGENGVFLIIEEN